MTKSLAQVVAIEADVRKQVATRLGESRRGLDAQGMLEGLSAEYQPLIEDGEQLPPEGNRVQATVKEMIEATRDTLLDLFDTTAARDYTNSQTDTVADVRVGEDVLVRAAPMPYLLWLDRQLDDVETFVRRLPTLPADTEWELVEERGVYRSEPRETMRQVNVHKVITMAEATDKHPAQTQLVALPESVGRWTRRKYSGAVPPERREQILRRIRLLRRAVHTAREQVKRVDALDPAPGAAVLSYLFD